MKQVEPRAPSDVRGYFISTGNTFNAIASATTHLELFPISIEIDNSMIEERKTKALAGSPKNESTTTGTAPKGAAKKPKKGSKKEKDAVVDDGDKDKSDATKHNTEKMTVIKKLWPNTFETWFTYDNAKVSMKRLMLSREWDTYEPWCKAFANFTCKEYSPASIVIPTREVLKIFDGKKRPYQSSFRAGTAYGPQSVPPHVCAEYLRRWTIHLHEH